MNVLVYVGQRLAVAAGLPSDGIDPAGRRATFILASVQMLVLHACGTAIFAHVLAPERRLLTRWTANVGFFVVASVTGIVFSALSDLTQLETSLSSRGGHSAAYVAVMCIVAFFILLGLWFHVWYARRSGTKLGVVPYLAPRLAVVCAYAAYIIILDFNNDACDSVEMAWRLFTDWIAHRRGSSTITSSPGSARSSARSTTRRRSSAWPSRREFLYKV